jgi:predicted aconitase with swiveling domain
MKLHGKAIVRGKVSGELLPTLQPLSFLGGVDPETGIVRDSKHELYGQTLKGKIFAIPYTVGSSVGAYVIYGMAMKKTNPAGIVANTGDINLVTGCAAAGIPLLSKIDINKLLGYRGKKAVLDSASDTLLVLDEEQN